MSNTISIGRWQLPEELVMSYIAMIRATEHSPGTRYNHEFDEQRRKCHQKLLEAAGIVSNDLFRVGPIVTDIQKMLDVAGETLLSYEDYCEFSKAMREFEDDIFSSEEEPAPTPKKLIVPGRGIIRQ